MGMTINEFAREISAIMPALMRGFLKRLTHITKEGDLTISHITILHALKGRNMCKMSEIAKFLSVTTSAATGTVDQMVRAKLLTRVRGTRDRRVINIRLTPKGKRTIDVFFKHRQNVMVDIFQHFTPDEREAYLKTVKKMHAILMKGKQ